MIAAQGGGAAAGPYAARPQAPKRSGISAGAQDEYREVFKQFYPEGRPRSKGGAAVNRPKAPSKAGQPPNGFAEFEEVRASHGLDAEQMRKQVPTPILPPPPSTRAAVASPRLVRGWHC